jgi:hypothetical protein
MTRNLILDSGKKVKTINPSRMSNAALADTYGVLDSRIKTLIKERDLLKEEALNRYEKKGSNLEGKEWDLEFVESTSYEYDNNKIYKALGIKKFLRVVRPVVKNLKKHLAPAQLQDMIITTKTTIRVNPKKKGGK